MGNALVDVLALIENDSILDEMNLPKGSMQLIDSEKLTQLNAAIENTEKYLASGGSASNTITAMAELGIQTGFLGKIGKDTYGNYYKEDLKKYGVRSHLIIEDEVSGVATTLISKDGERTFGTFLGVAANMQPEDLKFDDFSGYDYFYIEGYLVQNLDLIRRAIELAKEAGAKVILDMASYNVVEASRDFLLEIIPQYVDIIFANRDETKALLNLSIEEALPILGEQVELVILKDGSKGSWVQTKGERIQIPANKIQRVDTTGAGDLYAAGFLYGLVNDFPLEVCGRTGALLAEHVIQVIGAKLGDDRWLSIKEELVEIEKELKEVI